MKRKHLSEIGKLRIYNSAIINQERIILPDYRFMRKYAKYKRSKPNKHIIEYKS